MEKNEAIFINFPTLQLTFVFYVSEGRSCRPDLREGGAFQVSLSKLQLDFYPYHLACGDRSMWIRYQPETSVHTGWLENSLKQFQTSLLDSIASKQGSHAPLSRSSGNGNSKNSSLPQNQQKSDSNSTDMLMSQFRKLMTTNLVVRLNNFTLWKVSTSKVKSPPREFLAGKEKHVTEFQNFFPARLSTCFAFILRCQPLGIFFCFKVEQKYVRNRERLFFCKN